MTSGHTNSPTAGAQYVLLANPVAGSLARNQRWRQLKTAAAILQADIVGLDTGSAAEFVQCARQYARKGRVLVVAGGDGTMSLVINAVPADQIPLAFLPFGTGNALTHALGYKGTTADIARRIKNGRCFRYDLIDCDNRKKAFMASVGLDGVVIRNYEAFHKQGYTGLHAHMRAVLKAVFKNFRPGRGTVTIDGQAIPLPRVTSLMVVKQPYFGMGLNVVPHARWDDGQLHIRFISAGLPGIAAGLALSLTIGNRLGQYRTGNRITLRSERPLTSQMDGEVGWTAGTFSYSVIAGALLIKH